MPIDIRAVVADFKQKETSLWVPDIMEFVLSDQFLGRNIYPRQATMLKVAFLQTELFTSYDYDVIGEWTQNFIETEENGCQPDILERIKICKEENRPWFREWINVIGRRGSKGFLGALGGAYVLWHYICKGDPQKHYGIDRDKRLAMIVFGAKKEQAIANQWKDLTDVIKGAPCFSPYISKSLLESLTLYAPHDFDRMQDRKSMHVYDDGDMASFIILPKESTPTASRGPATFCSIYDEMAWITRQTAKADASEVWLGAQPALDTFGKDAWTYEPSSPWSKTGQFYENYCQALAISDGADGFKLGSIIRPEICMFQLESWDTYKDWEKADKISTMSKWEYDNPTYHPQFGKHKGRKHDFCFPHQVNAPQTFNDEMRKLEAANPENFAVERRSHWMAVLDAYLNPDRVENVFAPWPLENPQNLYMKDRGSLSTIYKFHGDPSKSGANFGWAGGHIVRIPGEEFSHVVFDVVSHWSPADFQENNYQIDYDVVVADIKNYIELFQPSDVTFDQGYSNWMISHLQKWVRERGGFARHINVYEKTASAKLNWDVAETFKTAIGLGLVHAPPYELAKQEMMFLQVVNEFKIDKPSAGPVQTKDVFDAMSLVVHGLIGNEISAFINQDLSRFRVRGQQQGGFPIQAQEVTEKTFNALRGWNSGSKSNSPFMPQRGRGGNNNNPRFGRR